MILYNWKKYLTGNKVPNRYEVNKRVNELDFKIRNTSGTGIWQQDELDIDSFFSVNAETYYSSSKITKIAENIYIMSLGYACEKSLYYCNKDLLEEIKKIIEVFFRKLYNTDVPKEGNWWDYEIGAPLFLVNVLVLLQEDLDKHITNSLVETIKHFITFKTGNTGANLLDKSFALLICAAFEKDDDVIKEMINNLNKVFDYVEVGDGFYEDGGFIQHYNIPYIGAYGEALISRTRDMIIVLKDTKYEKLINKKQIDKIILECYVPLLFKGCISNHTLGRSISRISTDCYVQAEKILISILEITCTLELSEEIYQELYSNFICVFAEISKRINVSSYYTLCEFMTTYSFGVAKIKNNSKYIDSNNLLIGRAHNLVTIGTCSKLISCFETGNGENLVGWYQSAGTYYIYGEKSTNYCNNYYSKVNMLKLPGITSDGKVGERVEWNNYYNDSDIVMGCSDDDLVVSSFFINYRQITGSNLTAKKTYIVVNDLIICVGSDISSNEAYTVVENRQLEQNDNILIEQNEEMSRVVYESKSDKIIYYNMSSENWNVKVSNKVANTNEININSTSKIVEGEFLELKYNHRTNASYQYIIDTYAHDDKRKSYIEIIETVILTDCHYIKLIDKEIIISFKKQKICGVNFEKPGICIFNKKDNTYKVSYNKI